MPGPKPGALPAWRPPNTGRVPSVRSCLKAIEHSTGPCPRPLATAEARLAASPAAAALSFDEAETRNCCQRIGPNHLPQRALRCGCVTGMLTDGVFECQSQLRRSSTGGRIRPSIYRRQEERRAQRPDPKSESSTLRKRIYDVISSLWKVSAQFAGGIRSPCGVGEDSKD